MGAAAEEQQPVPAGKREGEQRIQARAPPVIDTEKDSLLEKVGLTKKEDGKKEWNTRNLSSRLGVDAMCAGAAAGLVSPLIMIVDK